jgi:hypothetical protein
MDEQVDAKLREADWFLRMLKSLRHKYESRGGVAHVYDPKNARDWLTMESCVDGFLFVLVSAQDMLLQEVNRRYDFALPLGEVCIRALQEKNGHKNNSLDAFLDLLQKLHDGRLLITDPNYGWLVRLTKYRNAADHRCVLQLPPLYETTSEANPWSTIYLLDDPDKPRNVRYSGQNLFDFLDSVGAEMRTTLACWEADLGLTTPPTP